MTRTANMSCNAEALLRDALRASGLVAVEGHRYDGVAYAGTIAQWGAFAHATLDARSTARGTDRAVLTRVLRRNPALQSMSTWGRSYRLACRAARRA